MAVSKRRLPSLPTMDSLMKNRIKLELMRSRHLSDIYRRSTLLIRLLKIPRQPTTGFALFLGSSGNSDTCGTTWMTEDTDELVKRKTQVKMLYAIHKYAESTSTAHDQFLESISISCVGCIPMGRRVELRQVTVASDRFRTRWRLRTATLALITLVAGFLHYVHVNLLHENSLFFSHLSSREREMTFRTESGFYYSYFKQLILSPTLKVGWNSLLADTRTEYPRCWNASQGSKALDQCGQTELNAMQRFNLYPELILAVAYRLALTYGLLSQVCYRVNRDIPNTPIAFAVTPSMFEQTRYNDSISLEPTQTVGLEDQSIVSCVGLAEPSYFYIGSIFFLAAFIIISLVWSGWSVASSASSILDSRDTLASYWLPVWGALLPVVAYFFNHREATRVQWVPPLRENFAYPFFTLQQAWLLHLLSSPKTTHISPRAASFYCLLLLAFQLPWQFAQFALATQIASLFAACCITVAVGSQTLSDRCILLVDRVHTVVFVHLLALLLSFGLQFGNGLLMSSGYPAGLVGVVVGLRVLRRQICTTALPGRLESSNKKQVSDGLSTSPVSRRSRLMLIFWPPTVAVGFTIVPGLLLTRLLFPVSEEEHDGGHILDLLREKLDLSGQFRTFHTRLYTCAREFDFMSRETIKQPMETGLLPVAVLLSVWVFCDAAWMLWERKASRPIHSSASTEDIDWSRGTVQIRSIFISLFVIFQLCFFSIMAILIMRLKLFWTPQLCLSLALLAQPLRWNRLFDSVFRAREFPKAHDRSSSSTSGNRSSLAAHFLIVLLVAYMTVPGTKNLQAELDIRGQFSAYDDEALLDWFQSLPSPEEDVRVPWVIAGPMSTLGSLRLMLPAAASYPSTQLSTNGGRAWAGFAFTNHPHYENVELRRRTILAYAIYSRQPIDKVWHIYRHQLQADFVIVDEQHCHPREGCSNPELYDLILPQLAGRPALCESLQTTGAYHRVVTPSSWKPYFQIVYVDMNTGRVVLFVRRKLAFTYS
ncbi:putative C-mannosyltransferase dpy19l1 [Clonorchis sinensis]|uniref:C-mannosyltransferase dpy19l1 n=1 Tax=Clonorchis sinensis TaxID=79923 RepID=A0A419Q2E7_CLOSI|nr:putative C-mannosyltransferase dpy19l1 [Clonorchis sinensis]